MFDPTHLAALRAIPHVEPQNFGAIPKAWKAMMFGEDVGQLSSLSDKHLTRADIVQSARADVPAEVVFFNAMAWGGLLPWNARKMWHHRDQIVSHVEALRSGRLTRAAAFEMFRSKPVPHLGTAFFSKLIYFVPPHADDEHDRGFILDQWTAKSANLLLGKEAIRVTASGGIDPRTGPEAYERYCAFVVDLARELGDAPTVADERIFSRGNHVKDRRRVPPWPWRQHVLDHWTLGKTKPNT